MEEEDVFRENRVYHSLQTPLLFLGGERELSLMVVLLSVALVVLVQTPVSLILGLGLWLLGMQALRWMARRDPQFSRVYRRALGYRAYYPAASTPWLGLHFARRGP